MFLLFAIGSALFYGLGDFSGGFAAGKSKVLSVLVVSQAFGLVTAMVALAASWPGLPGAADLAWGLAGGLAGAFGIGVLYRGISRCIVAIVSPTAAAVSSILPLIVGFLLGERPGMRALIGMALCIPAILLLASSPQGSTSDRKHVLSSMAHGLAAGAGFGLFYVALSRPGVNSGFWPLISARTASILAALLLLRLRREAVEVNKGGWLPTVLAGILDMAANILFVLASNSGMLSVAAVIVSLYPAPTVLMARIVFRQRIGAARGLGFALSLAGLALISMK
jgi:drug/metabolite transporter (DMT)-like permease